MRFHKLEMVGFKSFVDKTAITFQDGMTAIVGPNGCGKSNISDAIRWVLGEKSAKAIRGDKMEDVIFNGTDIRKPTGMSEVSLTLENVDGNGALGFAEFKEITITRRLFRNGDSEYLINKIPCRLKDIRDLLIDTGMSSKAYAIIEQGKIGQLIVSKPEERRFIIEEVAGISKYKSRKVEALSKLKETEDNLDRVNDIVSEVKRQIGSLDRQAKKAERYKKLSDELKGFELKMAWDDFNDLTARAQETEEAFEKVSAGESAAKNAVSAREADLSEARIRLAESERELMDHQREVHRVESDVSRLEARAEVAVSQLKGLDEREDRLKTDRDLLAREADELDAQSSSLKEEAQALKAELDELREELQVLENEYQAKATRSHQLESGIDADRTKIFNIQAEISQRNNRLSRLEEQKLNLETRIRRGLEEERDTDDKLSEAKLAAEKKRMELDAARKAQAELEAERDTVESHLEETKSMLKALDAELTRGRETYNQKKSRLESLQELEENLEGYGEGVKALVKEKRHGALAGLHGLVADILTSSPEHERAIEAVLGDRLQNVVVGAHSDARECLEYLRNKGGGRGTFLPMSPREIKAGAVSGDGVIGVAAKLVKPKSGYSQVVSALLGNVVIMRDLDSAISMWESGSDAVLVTLDGEVVEPSGAVTGGASSSGGGLLSKKREIRELTDEVEKIAAENQSAEDRLAESRSRLDGLEISLRELHELINEKRILSVSIEKDFGALAAEADRLEKKAEILSVESAQREQEEQEITTGLVQIRQELDGLQDERQKREAAIVEAQAELKVVKEDLEREREGLTIKKMDLSALLQKHESSARDLKRADLQREELARRNARVDSEEREIKERRVELTNGKTEAETNINEMMKTVLELKARVPELQNAYETANESIAVLDEQVKIARREAEDARGAATELELRRAELKLKVEHLVETVNHNYHIAVTEIDEQIRTMEIERAAAEVNTAELRDKLEKLGPVNIGAIEEYNELMERFTFLSTQKLDLETSVARLREAIGKINKTSEELFMEAFNAINEKFKLVFLALFGGGRAELQVALPENGDILESGLEIAAQPPGKKLQSLMLCSGGEKALIAAALTFACFLVKPSPFCVLDEVDAPLDEHNVQRFGKTLKDFADKTQFIVITHSRPTMELADALYGVTMDEPGVSRLVSVKLNDAVEIVGA
ncbi:MAG TPA: chromosome segregation protein SMC [Nitrospirota bacterium]